jgi:hypothetical protein
MVNINYMKDKLFLLFSTIILIVIIIWYMHLTFWKAKYCGALKSYFETHGSEYIAEQIKSLSTIECIVIL